PQADAEKRPSETVPLAGATSNPEPITAAGEKTQPSKEKKVVAAPFPKNGNAVATSAKAPVKTIDEDKGGDDKHNPPATGQSPFSPRTQGAAKAVLRPAIEPANNP